MSCRASSFLPAGRRAVPVRYRPAGFTLLEVMLAVALAAMLLVAVNFFVLSMGELWSGGAEPRLFERHVRGVGRFLESLVDQAVVPDQTETKSAATGKAQSLLLRHRPVATPRYGAVASVSAQWSTVSLVFAPSPARLGLPGGAALVVGRLLGGRLGRQAWQVVDPPPDRGGMGRLPPPVRDADGSHPPPGSRPGGKPRAGATTSSADDPGMTSGARFHFGTPSGYEGSTPLLLFEIDEAPGQCVWPQRPLPQVECALQANADEGLVLLWKSKLEDDYGKARPRKTQLSPFGRALSFDYYDSDSHTWTHSDQPQSDGSGGWVVPQRVRITFVYAGLEREISITLPETPGGAPLR